MVDFLAQSMMLKPGPHHKKDNNQQTLTNWKIWILTARIRMKTLQVLTSSNGFEMCCYVIPTQGAMTHKCKYRSEKQANACVIAS